jgi:hypothetical protein
VSDEPLDLDKHHGMAAKKATDIRRVLTDVENNARDLRDWQEVLEKPTSVGSGCFPAGGSRQGTLPLEICMPRGWLGPTSVIAIWSRRYLQTSLGSQRRAERMVVC